MVLDSQFSFGVDACVTECHCLALPMEVANSEMKSKHPKHLRNGITLTLLGRKGDLDSEAQRLIWLIPYLLDS